MKIRPLYDRVVIRRKEEEETTAGGIVLPGSAKEKPNQGEVIAVGDGKVLDNGEQRALAVKVGKTVAFSDAANETQTFLATGKLRRRRSDSHKDKHK